MSDAKDEVARALLSAHESTCAERYGEIKDSFGRVHSRLDKILWGMIGVLLAILAYTVREWAPWLDKAQ